MADLIIKSNLRKLLISRKRLKFGTKSLIFHCFTHHFSFDRRFDAAVIVELNLSFNKHFRLELFLIKFLGNAASSEGCLNVLEVDVRTSFVDEGQQLDKGLETTRFEFRSQRSQN